MEEFLFAALKLSLFQYFNKQILLIHLNNLSKALLINIVIISNSNENLTFFPFIYYLHEIRYFGGYFNYGYRQSKLIYKTHNRLILTWGRL